MDFPKQWIIDLHWIPVATFTLRDAGWGMLVIWPKGTAPLNPPKNLPETYEHWIWIMWIYAESPSSRSIRICIYIYTHTHIYIYIHIYIYRIPWKTCDFGNGFHWFPSWFFQVPPCPFGWSFFQGLVRDPLLQDGRPVPHRRGHGGGWWVMIWDTRPGKLTKSYWTWP